MGNLCGQPAKLASASTPYGSSKVTSNSTDSSNKATSTREASSLPSFKSDASPSVSLKSFSLDDLKAATRNFRADSFLGEGGFGSVFKGGVQPISWVMRVNIAIDVARGLSFLHSLETQVILRDLKASNILLDSDFNARLSDFGLARNGPTGDKTHVSTKVVGTRGYAAPEYVSAGHLSVKSDMYSFGVVLLELLSGKRALDEDRARGEDSLVEWARPFVTDKRKMFRIMDTSLGGQYSKKEAQAIAALSVQCLHSDPKCRPNATEALETLEQLRESKDTTGPQIYLRN